MKKARKMEMDENTIYEEKEFNKFYEHAYNSSVWGINNYNYNSGRIRTKLKEKGYVENIKVNINNCVTQVNIIEKVIGELEEKLLLDDKGLAKRQLESKLQQGYGSSYVKTWLLQKDFKRELIDEVMEEYEEDKSNNEELNGRDYEFSGIRKTYERLIRSSSYKNKDEYKRKMYVTQSLVRKGFSFGEVNDFYEWLEENED